MINFSKFTIVKEKIQRITVLILRLINYYALSIMNLIGFLIFYLLAFFRKYFDKTIKTFVKKSIDSKQFALALSLFQSFVI